jgi:hypothetical protein
MLMAQENKWYDWWVGGVGVGIGNWRLESRSAAFIVVNRKLGLNKTRFV